MALPYDFQSSNSSRNESSKKSAGAVAQFDFIGIDYYRALGVASRKYPSGENEYLELLGLLNEYSFSHARDLDGILSDAFRVTGVNQFLALQEVGYQSVERCFIAPYAYEDDRAKINNVHQAVAWDSLLNSLWTAAWPWFRGVGVWQVLLDDDSDLQDNGGFSP